MRIFKDMKSSKMVSPIVWVSLELSCSRVPQTRSIATFTSSATWRMKAFDCVQVLVSKSATILYDSKNTMHDFSTSFSLTYLFLQLPVWYAEEIYFHCTVKTKKTRDEMASVQINVSLPGSTNFFFLDVQHWYSPVEEFVVDVLGSLHVCIHSINHLNQLLELLLQTLDCQ